MNNRFVFVGLGLAGLLGLVGCSAAASSPQDSPSESTSAQPQDLAIDQPYLALGDSVAFGYNPVDAVKDPQNLSAFVGYPELTFVPYPIANSACPGETSASFLDVTAPDNGCHAWRAAGDAMHVQYASASESQLQYALAFLASHPSTATVSLGIGANDLLLVQNACQAAFSTSDPNYATEVGGCELQQVPAAIQKAVGNVATIVGAIRRSGYTGQLALVTYYATQYANTSDPNLLSIAGLDKALVQLAQAYPTLNLSVAKGFSTFAAIATALGGGDSCKAGLLYKLADGTCNIHPSTFGQAVLAGTVAAAVPASSIDLSATTPQF